MVGLRKTRVSHFTAETVQPLTNRMRPAVACGDNRLLEGKKK